jgi:hypothetical protein
VPERNAAGGVCPLGGQWIAIVHDESMMIRPVMVSCDFWENRRPRSRVAH